MSKKQLLDPVLLSLADQFEANKGRFVIIKPSSVEEWEPLREFLALQVAEGLMNAFGTDSFRLTPKGYATYLPRIRALRAFAPAKPSPK